MGMNEQVRTGTGTGTGMVEVGARGANGTTRRKTTPMNARRRDEIGSEAKGSLKGWYLVNHDRRHTTATPQFRNPAILQPRTQPRYVAQPRRPEMQTPYSYPHTLSHTHPLSSTHTHHPHQEPGARSQEPDCASR